VSDVSAYIENQREHHRARIFQEEHRALLDRHGIKYDERYLWIEDIFERRSATRIRAGRPRSVG